MTAEALLKLWGKSGAGDVWHRLEFHMLDVAAVASLLLERHVPRAIRTQFATRLGVSLDVFDRWVIFLAALHDFGKAIPPFQVKVPTRRAEVEAAGLPFPRRIEDVPHGRYTASEETVALLIATGWPRKLARQAARWVGGHHGVFPKDAQIEAVGERGGGPVWESSRALLFQRMASLLAPPEAPRLDSIAPDLGLFIAGLTSVADWVGSMTEHFPFDSSPRSLQDYWAETVPRAAAALNVTGWYPWHTGPERSFPQLFGFQPRALQVCVTELVARSDGPMLAIVEAPMGEGKTEAAFFVAHELGRRLDHRGLYVALPTMATANQMFGRTRAFLEATYPGLLSMQLLHGGAGMVEAFSRLHSVVDDEDHRKTLQAEDSCGTAIAEDWFSKKKRGLLAPFAVGTIDQALLGVMRTRHGFVRLFGLSGKTVVLDEVHAYDAYTSRILDRLVAWLCRLGASVLILSATLPRRRREELCAQWQTPTIPDSAPYPRVTAVINGKPVTAPIAGSAEKRIHLENIDGDLSGAIDWLLERTAGGGCAGLLVNTVGRAQDAFRLARQKDPALHLMLLHARFKACDRQAREVELLEALGKQAGNRPDRVLVIGTQVLEQSLDIDFDVMATDHAPIDLLLQRTGRLHRHQRVRPAQVSTAVLGVVSPANHQAPAGPDFGVHALIYEPAVLLRSWLALLGITSLTLPDDLEPLIEKVYGEDAPPAAAAIAARVNELDAELATTIRQLERDADHRLLSPPDSPDDPFANFGAPLDEEDTEKARALQAVTRLGEPNAEIVCVDSSDAHFTTREPTLDECRVLLNNGLSLASKAVVFELQRQGAPPAWEKSPWLRNRRAVVFQNGVASVGKSTLIDDAELGIVISTPGKAG